MENSNKINQNLPQEFTPYPRIEICGNTLINMNYLINDNGFIPLMIGMGELPRIWIYAKRVNDAIVIVKDSVAVNPFVKVNIYNKEKRILIEINQLQNSSSIKILDINYSREIPIITNIDLRPIGYLIHGNKENLQVGNNSLTGNFFELDTLIRIENNNP